MTKIILVGLVYLNYVYAVQKLRGVAPADIAKYQPDENGNWHCLGDPTIIIPYDYVNDDYCDCPDGSDEPGTSACGNAVFYCANVGFKGNFIPTYKIDDGICDYDVCCDGSDEPDGVCGNKCEELKARFESDIKLHNERILKGLKIKESIVQKSSHMKQSVQESIQSITLQIEATNRRIQEIEVEKKKLDENQQLVDGKFDSIYKKLEDTSSSLQSQLKEISLYIEKLESLDHILKRMTNEYNHNFNDPAVKEAANEYLNFAAVNENAASIKGNIGAISNNIKTATDVLKGELETTKDELLFLIKNHPKGESQLSIFDKCLSFLEKICTQFVESFIGVQSRHNITPSISKAMSATQLSDELNSLNKELAILTRKLHDEQVELTKDYGEDDILRPFTDCIETNIGDYKYKLCLHSTLEQINKDNKATKIGVFEHIEFSESTKNYQIRYNRGERCWNGPVREAIVDVVCGTEQKILQVTEPEKCLYNIRFESPIGCFESDLIIYDEF